MEIESPNGRLPIQMRIRAERFGRQGKPLVAERMETKMARVAGIPAGNAGPTEASRHP
jgi:hypothetical protein